MQRKDRGSSRWRTLLSTGIALAGVAIIGAVTIAPAKADYDDWRWHRDREWREHRAREEWRREEWREHHPRAGIYFYSTPGYYEYER